MNRTPTRLDYDWYDGEIPANVILGEGVYIDTSHAFAVFDSERDPGLSMAEASGVYDRTAFVTGPHGQIHVGAFTCLNAVYLICNDRIEIGQHCLLAWGAVLTDTWLAPTTTLDARRATLHGAATDPRRRLSPTAPPRPVVLEDNVWVGFDAVVLPGVRLGRGCLVGCKTVIAEDVPPYAVVAGNPARVIRFLEPDDTPEAREAALREHGCGASNA